MTAELTRPADTTRTVETARKPLTGEHAAPGDVLHLRAPLPGTGLSEGHYVLMALFGEEAVVLSRAVPREMPGVPWESAYAWRAAENGVADQPARREVLAHMLLVDGRRRGSG